MADPLSLALAHRLFRAIGLSTLALPALASAACGGNVVVDASGSGGAASTSISGTGGSLPACIGQPACTPDGPPGPSKLVCFTPDAGQGCPAPSQAKASLMVGCAQVTSVESACSGGPAGSCCYNVTIECTCIGRPLLVDGAPRTATTLRGDGAGWQPSRALEARDTSDLPPATRRALAAAFAEDALGEHASIASFGRFALELLALGAPADLVAGAHRAALDEVRHAQIMFGFASAFGGAPLGPGALACDALPLRADLASFARALAGEGCVGETLAALVAAARARAATDERVASALASVAEDEAGHAELAWRTMAWVLRVGGDDVKRAALSALAEAATEVLTSPRPAAHFGDLRAFGVLAPGEVHERLVEAVASIIEPCAQSLREAASHRPQSTRRARAPAAR
jgi:hypothetical protein